jgi:fructosamine-3-kinase
MTDLPVIPAPLEAALTALLDGPILGAVAVGGGMINSAAQIATGRGTFFVKWNTDAPPDFFAQEAHGLELLRATHTLRVPTVIGVGATAIGPFLLLEWIDEGIVFNRAEFSQRFAVQLAYLHRTSASPEGRFGLHTANYVGLLPQRNEWRATWPESYRECRLRPQIEIARQRGHLSPEREALLSGVVENLDYWLGDFEARPVLLHGDLWSGNYLTATAGAVVIDPAVYYGEREVELAFIELFGGFPAGFMGHYAAAFPLDPGYERRRALHQLYPLLVHLNLFGEPYGKDVERVCRSYIRK